MKRDPSFCGVDTEVRKRISKVQRHSLTIAPRSSACAWESEIHFTIN